MASVERGQTLGKTLLSVINQSSNEMLFWKVSYESAVPDSQKPHSGKPRVKVMGLCFELHVRSMFSIL